MPITELGLHIPPSATIHNKPPKWRCRVPGCDVVFYEGEERARDNHAVMHVRRDGDLIREAASEEHLNPVYGEGDPEKAAWLKRRYRQLVGKVADPHNPKHY